MTGDEKRSAGRAAAVLFTAAGALSMTNVLLPRAPGSNPAAILVIALIAVGVGGLAAVLPWERWPDRALLVLVPIAFLLIGFGNRLGGGDQYTYAVYYVVIFAWLGMSQPRWTSLALGPLAVATYSFPFILTGDEVGVRSVNVAIPVCVLIGEIIARDLEQLREARKLDTRRAGGMEALVTAGTALHAEADRRHVGDLTARLAGEIADAPGVAVVLTDGAGGFVAAGAHGLHPADAGDALYRSTVARRLCDDASVLLPAEPEPVGDVDLVVPLQGAVRTIGALVVRFPATARDPFASHAVQLFAAQAGLAIEQLDVIEALTDAAVRDGLTGVGNRRHADALVAGLAGGDAVVVIDLDHFKLVNDTEGHAAGDAVLVALGRFLTTSVRNADDVARYGGEEFIVVLRGVGDRAAQAAGRLVDGWRATEPSATMSAGVAVHTAGDAPSATLARADAALYEAKRTGRDRCTLAA